MSVASTEILTEGGRSNWVRLRTLIVLRWIAIAGQIAALFVARWLFNLDLNLGWSLVAVSTSVLANLAAILVYPENKRLSEREVMAMLLFDIAQLTALLYLTGGLHNPFAILILAPVIISATALRTRSTIVVGFVAICLVTVVMVFHVPLITAGGNVMRMPREFVFGFWVAIIIGVLFLGIYAERVSSEINTMSEALLATQMALAREQKISDLAGVVAATAHELGTPLATIKLASSELIEELGDQAVLREDAELIREQADRCRDILRSMGRAGKDDRHLQRAPLTAVIKEAADPHADRGKSILISPSSLDATTSDQPEIFRRPEMIHGLRNLIQNAVDFAATTVWIDVEWSEKSISVRILDDGQGFPAQILGRIGDPFVRVRKSDSDQKQRPGYEGMGLGLFIAKTLLERSGAELTFANGRDSFSGDAQFGARDGAIVDVIWPLEKIVAQSRTGLTGLGPNEQILA